MRAHMWSAACVSAFRVLTRVCVSSQRVKAFPLVFTAHSLSLFSPCASVLVKGLMSRRRPYSRKMSQSLAQRMVWVDLEVNKQLLKNTIHNFVFLYDLSQNQDVVLTETTVYDQESVFDSRSMLNEFAWVYIREMIIESNNHQTCHLLI